MAGFGGQPFGGSSYSFGTPTTSDGFVGNVLVDSDTGAQEGSRYIDPVTRDFVLDGNGRVKGHANVRHLVQMAIQTARGSASVRDIGINFDDLEVITGDFQRRLDGVFGEALAHLVRAGYVEPLGVRTYSQGPSDGMPRGRVRMTYEWRDVSSGKTFREEL
jgi:hypothetical protein